MATKPYMAKFGVEMKRLAKLRGLAVDDIAEAVALSRATVFNHFNCATSPRVMDIVKYLQWTWDPFFHSSTKFTPKNSRALSATETEIAIRANITALYAIMNGEVR